MYRQRAQREGAPKTGQAGKGTGEGGWGTTAMVLEQPASLNQLAAPPGATRWREFAVASDLGRARLKQQLCKSIRLPRKAFPVTGGVQVRAAHPPVRKGI